MVMKSCCFLLLALCFCGVKSHAETGEFFRQFGPGINLGNALEAEKEGQWGVTLQEEYFQIIHQAGFQHVRIPVKWSAHALDVAPYTIEEKFFDRVDWAIENAQENNLSVVLNIHHYDELMEKPDEQRDRYLGIWKQLATHYQDQPTSVAFELLNEPKQNLIADRWNSLVSDSVAMIRQWNPDRYLIVGPVFYNNYRRLPSFKLPDDRQNIIVTIHHYEPFHFTHQGAKWASKEADQWIGTTWSGTDEEKAFVNVAFDQSQAWAKEEGVALYLGEFGAYSKADMESRARWTSYLVEEANRRKISWAYWEFCAGFGAYDSQKNEWRPALKKALISD
jgi:endoglucanase